MTGEIYCPKCKKQVNDSPENMPVFQPVDIEVIDLSSSESPPLPTRHVEPVGRYCCYECNSCFIIEEGF